MGQARAFLAIAQQPSRSQSAQATIPLRAAGRRDLTCWWSAMGCYRCQARCWATHADPAVQAAWLDNKFLPPDVLEWALNVAVVRSGDRTILIDAGQGADRT